MQIKYKIINTRLYTTCAGWSWPIYSSQDCWSPLLDQANKFTIICIHRRVPRPRFPVRRENFGHSAINKGYIAYFSMRMREPDSFILPVWNTFKVEIGVFIFAWIFKTFGPNGRFCLGNRERGCPMLTPKQLLLTFGGCYLCADFGENRECRPTQTDRQTLWQRQTQFIIWPAGYML